jgi:hypothetical protein
LLRRTHVAFVARAARGTAGEKPSEDDRARRPAVASSMSESPNTMFGLLPPSSKVTFFKLPAVAWAIDFPPDPSVDPPL